MNKNIHAKDMSETYTITNGPDDAEVANHIEALSQEPGART